MLKYLIIVAGGFLGVNLRYLLQALSEHLHSPPSVSPGGVIYC